MLLLRLSGPLKCQSRINKTDYNDGKRGVDHTELYSAIVSEADSHAIHPLFKLVEPVSLI